MMTPESRAATTATMDRPGSWPMSDDPRVVAALETYLDEVQAGRRPSRREFLDNHPDIAGALGACLDGLEFLRSAAQGLSSPNLIPGLREAIAPATCLGDYRIIREVGRGGMGVVYEAEQISLGRRVALKVLPFAAAIDPKQKQRFHVEAQAAAHLHHPHIVPIFAVGNDGGSHFYAMPFIEGRTLAAMIQELRRFGGMSRGDAFLASRIAPSAESAPTADAVEAAEAAANLTTCEKGGSSKLAASGPSSSSHKGRAYYRAVARLGVEAAEALEHAHSLGVLHRDIKPANLIIDQQGKLWVTDFGLARFRDDPGPTRTGDLLGTLRYMSPEQLKARRGVVDQRADVYALGATLYEALTLRPAFTGRDRQEIIGRILSDDPTRPRKIDPAIPRDLETILIKAMAKDPAARYATAQELADDLRRFLDDQAILACPPPPWDHCRRWVRKHRTMVMTAATVLLAASTVCSILVVSEQRKTAASLKDTSAALRDSEEKLFLAAQAMDTTIMASQNLTMRAMETVTEYGMAVLRRQDVPFFEMALHFYEGLERTLKNERAPKRREMLAKAYFGLGLTKMMLYRGTAKEDAAQDYLASARVYEELIAELPQRLDLNWHLAATLKYLAMNYAGSPPYDYAKAEQIHARVVELERKLVEQDPTNDFYNGHLDSDLIAWGHYLQKCDRPKDAQRVYAEELERHPDSALALNNMAWLLAVDDRREPHDPRRAVELARKAVKLAPMNPNYHNTLAMALMRSGGLDEAIKSLETSMSLNKGGTPHDWLMLAMIHQRKGDKKKAQSHFDDAKKAMEKRNYADEELDDLSEEAAEVLGIKRRAPRRNKAKLQVVAPAPSAPARSGGPVLQPSAPSSGTPRAFMRQSAYPTPTAAEPN